MAPYDEDDDYCGDPRRCPAHPDVVTSSPDGMFDAPCGKCEAAMDREAEEDQDADSVWLINGHEVERLYSSVDYYRRCRCCGREDWTGDEEWEVPCPGSPPALRFPDDDSPF